jgi:hypothetical protein
MRFQLLILLLFVITQCLYSNAGISNSSFLYFLSFESTLLPDTVLFGVLVWSVLVLLLLLLPPMNGSIDPTYCKEWQDVSYSCNPHTCNCQACHDGYVMALLPLASHTNRFILCVVRLGL